MKRVICLLLALVMALGLAACGGQVSETVNDLLGKTDEETQNAVAEVLTRADERRAAILSGETAIVKGDEYIMGETYSGAAYYVSNHGSDENDGLSPETPFATMAPFHGEGRIELQYGDAVFFERGSVWRAIEMPWELRYTEGLTFSAYGTGDKPAFYGSEENGAGAEKWSLHYEDDDGRKVWVYYKEMTEVATIVLNGETPVLRDVAWWNGEAYMQLDDRHERSAGAAYDVTQHLPDLWCFPALSFPNKNTEQLGERIFWDWDEESGQEVFYTGPLYFRCDAGNPGGLYDDIEFIEPYSFVDGHANDQTYDNLCICYSSMTFTAGRNEEGATRGGVVQNCEIGWMGGNVFSYATGNEAGDTRIQLNAGLFGRNGGAMSANGGGAVIRDNYVHDAFQEGIALETFIGDESMAGCLVRGNLIERATQGILLCNWDMEVDPDHIFKDITIEDNIVLDSGVNNFFSTDWENDFCNAMVLQGGPCASENLVIRDNVFAYATGALVQIDEWSAKYSRVFSDNTYIQYQKGSMNGRNYRSKEGVCLHDNAMPLTVENAAKYLGDETATVYLVNPEA